MDTKHQQIRFCKASDGVRLAYALSGSGPPLVKASNYLTHLEHDWRGPVWKHWLRELSEHNTLIRYDQRGCGLSDREIEDYSMNAWIRDLEAVVAAARVNHFALLGISQGASVSVAYAAKHPDKVSHLVLYGGYARGRYNRDLTPRQRLEAETMINVIRVGWGQQNPAFRQLFSTQLMPEGNTEQIEWLNKLARVSASPEEAALMEEAFYHIDIRDIAPTVKTPALVIHNRYDAAIPFEEGRLLASLLPNARFISLESKNHILLQDEPAWPRFLDEVCRFLDRSFYQPRTDLSFADLTPREREVLHCIAQGLSNQQIAQQLFISPKTVRNHITHIFSKLDINHRSEAIVRAREAGFG